MAVLKPRRAALACCLAAACAVVPPAAAQPLDEYEVKAAFVYNFAKFVEWPAEVWQRPGPLRLCHAGPVNEFAAALERLGEKPPVNGKAVAVQRLAQGADTGACHVLALTWPERVATEWLQRAAGRPVLTVGDAPGFAAAGGAIGLVLEGDRVRFEVNAEAAREARLRLSSQLLKLARLVKGTP